MFPSVAGVVAEALVAGLLTFWTVQTADSASNPLLWGALGPAIGLVVPFVTGALANLPANIGSM